MELDAGKRFGLMFERGDRRSRRACKYLEPIRRLLAASPWLIQTVCSVVCVSNSLPAVLIVKLVRPNSDVPVFATLPPSASAIDWNP